MSKFAKRHAAPARKRKSYPRNPKAAHSTHRRKRTHRNPPLFSGDLFRDAGLGLVGFLVAHWSGNLAGKVAPSGFLSTPAGQTAIQAAVAIGAGHIAGRMMPGARSAVTAGGMVAAGRGLLTKIGIPGLAGLGEDAMSEKDLAEVRLLASELKKPVAGFGSAEEDYESGYAS